MAARRSKSESRILAVDTPSDVSDPNYNTGQHEGGKAAGTLVSAFIRSKEGQAVSCQAVKQQHRLSWDGGSGTTTASMESPGSDSAAVFSETRLNFGAQSGFFVHQGQSSDPKIKETQIFCQNSDRKFQKFSARGNFAKKSNIF